ncbi:thiamine phosphate synthase [Arcobacter sp. FWKO B]|uniref:thiamine phosphate synthase n=1 Tax=Arcobacter sp. FWKO B TaxID=2593672 RepID=UPI0018A40BCC|nr:thiamine phosphate synthase [Arcobacter sp. FWKO B]QOG11330.1 thiamine phosphate synthase [Arcobacter sp. FWKO B]
MLKGLYVITNEIKDANNENLTRIEQVLKSGANIIQLRNKYATDDEIMPLALEIKNLAKQYNATFIIDDRVELAKRIDSDGVHIGKFDSKLKEIRYYLKHMIIGVSCYGNIKYALEMERLGANYVAFGSFFKSPTKPESTIIPLDTISNAKKLLKVPVCAIGGITIENAPLLLNQNVDMISVISDIWNNNDIMHQTNEYTNLIKGYK